MKCQNSLSGAVLRSCWDMLDLCNWELLSQGSKMIIMIKPIITEQWEATEDYKTCSSSKYKSISLRQEWEPNLYYYSCQKGLKQTRRWTTGQWGQTRFLFCPSEWQLPVLSVYSDIKGGNSLKSKEYAYSSVFLYQRGKKKMKEKHRTETKEKHQFWCTRK